MKLTESKEESQAETTSIHSDVDLKCSDCPPLPPKSGRSSRTSSSSSNIASPPVCKITKEVVVTDSGCEINVESPTSSGDVTNDATITSDETSSTLGSDSGCEEAEENYDNVDPPKEITPFLQEENEVRDKDSEAVVVHVSHSNYQTSWMQLLRATHDEKRAREAAIALGGVNSPNMPSPFGYKSWLLTLSRRRRLEILFVIGLFLWIGFFVALAISMNGKSHTVNDPIAGSRPDKIPGYGPPLPNNTRLDVHSTLPQNGTPPTSASIESTTSSYTTSVAASTVTQVQTTPDKNSINVIDDVILSSTYKPTTIDQTQPINYGRETSLPKAHKMSTTPTPTITSSSGKRISTSHATTSLTGFRESSVQPETEATLAPSTTSDRTSSAIVSRSTTVQARIDTNKTLKTEAAVNDAKLLNRLQYDLPSQFNLTKVFDDTKPNYMIGIGRADITGPAADVNMMGYANPDQVAGGIHMRQYARAFIIGQGRSRIVFVNIDACMGSMLVKLEVLKILKTSYGDQYTADNLCISGIHTHSAPAGFLQDVLFQVTSLGYIPETLTAMVNGIVESIRIAHSNYAPGYILINKGELLETNINRSPSAYKNNPQSEKDRYKFNVDKEMTLIKFLDAKKKGIGMINWFPVHCTSMNNTNSLISGDNKGYAELLFEGAMDPGALAGQSKFVAAFAQSNEGDVSPNTHGPHCIDTGLPCDDTHSTCGGKVQNCIATGPGKDMFESNKIIGNNQYLKAMELYHKAGILLRGPVQAVHQYIDMTNQTVKINSTYAGHTCKPAMGFSFAAGTTDGPGAFDFKQSDTSGNAFWKVVRNFMHPPSQEQIDCHHPKPILLDTGEMEVPYAWQPNVVDTQLFRVGQLLISAVPGEFTTMSGRRLMDAVLEEFSQKFQGEKFESVIAGLSNTYSDYIATFEEYKEQRYEGASTIHGPHTLASYIQQYRKMAVAMAENKTLQGGAKPHDMKDKLLSFLPGVITDTSPFGNSFGDVLKEANDAYKVGEVVSVQYVSGNPRNSPTVNMTFLTVERETEKDIWTVVYTDASWYTRYIWERPSYMAHIRGLSQVTVKWEIPPETPSGHYRINHYGHYKWFWNGGIYSYHGQSKSFIVKGGSS
ncbi:unnamed protein product [Clavelina lepadiformis]|uniref:Neutral ceramidase n=1 Tax=Clavelina lepadiformis TaxID=159417 RepID=A0ABP0F9R1_CLALP